MRMTTLTLAAAFTLSASSAFAMGGCNWGKHEAVAQTPVDTSKLTTEVAAAPAPVDAWLIKYLDAWQKA